MKYLNIITLCAALFLVACGGGEGSTEDKVEGNKLKRLKAQLVEKKTELKALQKEVDDLEKEIAEIEPPKEDGKTLVTVKKIDRKSFATYVEIQGSVQSDNTYKASSEAAGRLIKFDLKEGQFVKKGQFIGEVDMESVNKQIAELNTALDLAKTTYERQKRLWDQNIGSEMQYLQAKNQKERLEKSLETIRFQLTKSKIYAPASGEVVMTYVKQGDVISPGMPLVEILNLSRVQVHADVPETYLSSVKKGQTVKVNFPALEKEVNARITLIGQRINPANRTFKIEMDMANSGNLKPNLLATVLIKDFSQNNAVVLPVELIQQEVSGKSYVFVKDTKEGKTVAKKLYVELGETYDGETLITEGLTGDEEFVIKGARDLKAGELIEVK